MRIETKAVHSGHYLDPVTGAVAQPIYLSTTFERDADGQYRRGFSYSRDGSPNRMMLERSLADLEGGQEAIVLSSGLAVTSAVVQGLEAGDHLLAPTEVYYGLKQVIQEVFGRWPVGTTYVDMTDLEAVSAAVRPNTRLIWVETPSNPLLKITDLAGIAAIGRKANAVTVCDGTFTTPVFQRPLDLGIDMVMHSTTKYISGHSDVVGGVLIRRHENYLFERVRKIQQYGGAVPSAFDCWLTLRGVETLPCRVKTQAQTAGYLAKALSQDARIEAVHYPGLPSHPQHQLAAAQMVDGFGGMLSIQVRGCRDRAMAVTTKTKLFIRATSLGGTHSLIEHRASVEGKFSQTPQNLLRISVGLEHPDDLLSDLDQALAAVQ